MSQKSRSVAAILIAVAILLAVGGVLWKVDQFTAFLGRFVHSNGPAVTEVMTSGETIVMRTPGGTLEIARIKATENLRRNWPGMQLAWGLVDTGTTVSEIDVATLFRYHIEMAQEWPMRCERSLCVVRAGPIKPTLPPAIYSDEMRKRTSSGWARFDKRENLAALEKSMTEELSKRASTQRNMQAATDAGRLTVKEFVKTWLLKSKLKAGEGMPRVVVLFPGESGEAQRRND